MISAFSDVSPAPKTKKPGYRKKKQEITETFSKKMMFVNLKILENQHVDNFRKGKRRKMLKIHKKTKIIVYEINIYQNSEWSVGSIPPENMK